jgi:flagellar FliL protein
MVASATTGEGTAAERGADSPSTIVIVAIMTAVSIGLGAGFGFFLLNPTPEQVEAASEVKPVNVAAEDARFRFPPDAIELQLAPIIATVGEKANSRMRLECSIVVTKQAAALPVLKSELTNDIVAFLRSISIEDVSGAHGFQNLREDLDDIARIRGRGVVLGLLITGLVVE